MTETAELVLFARPRPGVAVITLNRPSVHNALDDRTIHAMNGALDAVQANGGVHVILFEGAGKSFCAGADARWARHFPDHGFEENHASQLLLPSFLLRLREAPQVTVALVHGAVRGGGVGFVAACDVAFATRDASFSINEVRLGFMPATIAPYLIEAMGMREARRWCVTGEVFDGMRALRMGLVHEVGDDPAAIREMGERLVDEALQCPPEVAAMTKRLMAELRFKNADARLLSDLATRTARQVMAGEARESFTAFLEKRKPRRTGP
jgi:methylglutaconyl-CoA hydratase